MQNYECRYKDRTGAECVTTFAAESSRAAMQVFSREHPGCIMLTVPRAVGPVKGNASTNHVSIVLWLVVGVAIACGCFFVGALTFGGRNHNENVPNEMEGRSGDKKHESMYEKIYPHVVKVSLSGGAGTGFKVRDRNVTYLYTCLHCIASVDPIVAVDCNGKELFLSSLEMCDRDLVRFELPDEKDGLSLASARDIVHGRRIIAYGNTQARGVMTENEGVLLAVGDAKIEIDAEVLQGNSGGPVVTSQGLAIGAVSDGFVDKRIHAKNTRYEKVRRFAVRVDNPDWVPVDYEDYRNAFGIVKDSATMILELKEFVAACASVGADSTLVRPLPNNNRYLLCKDYPTQIESLYSAFADRVKKSVELRESTAKYNVLNDVSSLNKYKQELEAFNALEQRYSYDIPMSMLKAALASLKDIEYLDLKEEADNLIKEIETVLMPCHEKSLADLAKRQKSLDAAYKTDLDAHYRVKEELEKEEKRIEKEVTKVGKFRKASRISLGSPKDWSDTAETPIHGPGEYPDPDYEGTRILYGSVLISWTDNGRVLLRNDKTFLAGVGVMRELRRWRRGDDIEVATAYNRYGSVRGFWLINRSLDAMIYVR